MADPDHLQIKGGGGGGGLRASVWFKNRGEAGLPAPLGLFPGSATAICGLHFTIAPPLLLFLSSSFRRLIVI